MASEQFGPWLREQRARCRLSQEKAGALIGVSGAAISRWESEIDAPEAARFAAIESAYALPAGTIERMRTPPVSGASLDYWVGRWEQQTLHLRRVLLDQEELLAFMKGRAGDNRPSAAEVAQVAIEATRREAAPAPTPLLGTE